MLALLGSLPVLGTLIQFVVGKVFDSKVAITQARLGADRDVAVAAVKAAETQAHEDSIKLGIIASNTALTILLIGFSAPILFWFWQVVLWDITLCPHFDASYGFACNTDPIRGQAADVANTVVYFLFGAPTALGIAKFWFAKK